MKETMLSGAKRKMEAIGVLKKKKATKPDFTVMAHFLAVRWHPLKKSFASEQSRRAPKFALGTFVLENFYEPFKKKRK